MDLYSKKWENEQVLSIVADFEVTAKTKLLQALSFNAL